MIIDQNYYVIEYKGTELEEIEFNKLNSIAQPIIEYITRRNETQLLAYPFLNNIKNAICSQIDYMASNGGEDASKGKDLNGFKSESIGSYTYTKSSKNSDVKYINGIAIAPMIEIYLSPTGLLYSGVICVG